jgi:hypothetical protein
MFAPLMNWRELLARVRTRLEPDDRLLMHILPISTRIATRPSCGGEWGVSHFRMTAA